MIGNKLRAILDILTHRHCYIIPMHGKMTDDEIVKTAFNQVCAHYLGRNIKDWESRTEDSLQARCDMMSTALHDKNVIMLSENDGKYSIMRDCDTSERVDELMNLCPPEEEEKEETDDANNLITDKELEVGTICPYDTSKKVRVGSNACWQCPAYRAILNRGKYILCDRRITSECTLNGK